MATTVEFHIRRLFDGSYAADARLTSDASAAVTQLASNVPVAFDEAALLAMEPDLTAYGALLSAQLFADARLRDAWLKARAFAATGNLQFRLNLDAGDPALHALRWETLRDPETDQPVALHERVRLVRTLDSPDLTPVVVPPRPNLRALVVVANPSNLVDFGLAKVDVDSEVARARTALGDISATIQADHAEASSRATLANLSAALRDAPPIVILVAHGTLVKGSLFLWLEWEDGTADQVAGSTFVEQIGRLSTRPQLLILASCRSAGGGYDDTLRALGPQLASAGVPAVLAFQGEVALSTVKTLLPVLLTELRRDGQIDRAVAAARAALGEQRPWWQAILWLRTDGRLWREEESLDPRLATLTEIRPFMADDLPQDFVVRSAELEALVGYLIGVQVGGTVAIATALRGAGGYGKTTLAQAVCHDPHIRAAFTGGILWVTLGETPGDLTSRIEDLIEVLTEIRPGFVGVEAATARLKEVLSHRVVLLVIDDVWNAAHLKPFIQGGPRCARLITTRDRSILPQNTSAVDVDAMRQDEAVALLGAGFPPGQEDAIRSLAARLGEWPLLLKLANGALHERARNAGQSLPAALAYIDKALNKRGLTAFDPHRVAERSQAVAKTLDVSLELLSAGERARYAELAIFPEDVDIPLLTLEKLWSATGGLDDFDTEELCARLNRLSLLLRFDLVTRTIRLHDVMRAYLVREQGGKPPEIHGKLLDAHRPLPQPSRAEFFSVEAQPGQPAFRPMWKEEGQWADLPADEPYLWDHLAYHLIAAGNGDEFLTTVQSLRYLATKSLHRKALAVEGDLRRAEELAPEDVALKLLRYNFVQSGHLLNRCDRLNDLSATLYSRLHHLSVLAPRIREFARSLRAPYLTSWRPLPDLPHPALLRTLSGHEERVVGCAISADGTFIVSAACDKTLKLWDTESGAERLTLVGHTSHVIGCAISEDNTTIVSAAYDKTLKVWDARSGLERFTLLGHTDGVLDCAISADGTMIVSASKDGTLKVWDAFSGNERLTLRGHTEAVTGCAISADNVTIISVSADHTLRIWDAQKGVELLTLPRSASSLTSCAISQDATTIISTSADGTIDIWDFPSCTKRMTLSGHTTAINGCAISTDGATIVSAAEDLTLKIWDATTGAERATLIGHKYRVNDCAIGPDGTTLVSAASDGTLKVWDIRDISESFTRKGHSDKVSGCAISSDGTFIVTTSYDRTLKVWDTQSGSERMTFFGHTNTVISCDISLDSTFIVSASWDKTLKVWDARSGAERLTFAGHTDAVWDCAISPDGTYIVSAGRGALKVWDAGTGIEQRTLVGHTAVVNSCAVSPDGTFIVSASADKTLKVWDAKSGIEQRTLAGHRKGVRSCVISSDGTFIVSTSDDLTLKVWNVQSGSEIRTLTGHADTVFDCAVSPDSTLIASTAGSISGALKIWDIRTGECLTTLHVDGGLSSCKWFPDGERIVAVGAGGVYFLRLVKMSPIEA